MPRNLSGVIKGKRHSYTIDVTFVRPSDPHRIELSRTWKITARDENDYIMALQHKRYDVQGVQFHPESVLTPTGEDILRNWLKA